MFLHFTYQSFFLEQECSPRTSNADSWWVISAFDLRNISSDHLEFRAMITPPLMRFWPFFNQSSSVRKTSMFWSCLETDGKRRAVAVAHHFLLLKNMGDICMIQRIKLKRNIFWKVNHQFIDQQTCWGRPHTNIRQLAALLKQSSNKHGYTKHSKAWSELLNKSSIFWNPQLKL